MKSFNEINKIGNPIGITLKRMPNFTKTDPDAYPKYGLYFEDTRAAEILGQSCYLNCTMEGVNEDFDEVYKLCFEPECTCEFNPSVDKKQDLILASEDCPLHS